MIVRNAGRSCAQLEKTSQALAALIQDGVA